MKALLYSLLILFGGFGCARIYRPVAMAPSRPTVHTEGLAATVTLQPWGDNSRYEAKALQANLRILVLGLENGSGAELEVLHLELPEATSLLTAEEALKVVKQQPLYYVLYPLIPGLTISSAIHKTFLTSVALAGLAIGLPNAAVAAASNERLGAFFRERAWSPGILRPGQLQQGLVFLQNPDPYAPLIVQIRYRNPAGEQRLELSCPGVKPLWR